MELDEEADSVLEVVPVVTGDEEDDENANKRLKVMLGAWRIFCSAVLDLAATSLYN